MELAFLFIVFGVIFGIATIANNMSKSTNRRPCTDFGRIHKWVWKGEEGNEYMVCEDCKHLPSGLIEEGNDKYDL